MLGPAEIRGAEHPAAGVATAHWSTGVATPSRAIATRLRDSPTLIGRGSANSTARRAPGTPGQPRDPVDSGDEPSRADEPAVERSVEHRHGFLEADGAGDVDDGARDRRHRDPADHGDLVGFEWRRMRRAAAPCAAPAERRGRVTCTRASGRFQTGSPCSTAAD